LSTNESFRALGEARKAVAGSTRPVSVHEAALQRYLAAVAHHEQVERSRSANRSGEREPLPAGSGVATGSAAGSTTTAVPSPPTPGPEHPAADELTGVRTDLVVAGVDASVGSGAAVQWAAAEAARRHGALRLVHARMEIATGALAGVVPGLGYPTLPPRDLDEFNAALNVHGEALLDAVAATVRRAHPTLEVTTRLAHDDAASALRRESEHAGLTVVGSRGAGRLTGVILGSVALSVASGNPAPVAVIHPDDPADGHGPVVVGVDGAPTSEAAVAFAFDEAALRHTDLIAVHSWNDSVIAGDFPGFPLLVDPVAIEQEEHALLSEQLAGWPAKYPDVSVHHLVVRGRPTPTLLDAAHTAQLVVVGSRGRGGFIGLLLGSTSHALIAHGGCPVVVVGSPASA